MVHDGNWAPTCKFTSAPMQRIIHLLNNDFHKQQKNRNVNQMEKTVG